MKHLEKISDIKILDAWSQGIIEQGTLSLSIEGTEIDITIQQHNNGHTKYLLDDYESKNLLESKGVEFEKGYSKMIIGPENFLINIFEEYSRITAEKR